MAVIETTGEVTFCDFVHVGSKTVLVDGHIVIPLDQIYDIIDEEEPA